jgi:hypothetical protein
MTAINPSRVLAHPCPCCGGRVIVIETFTRPTRLFARQQDRHVVIEIGHAATQLSFAAGRSTTPMAFAQ